MKTTQTLWYLFHESFHQSRGNRTLLQAKNALAKVEFVDAYTEYPDFQIDVEKEQNRLRAADLVIFQHPFYWYSCPALFKQWQDKVLTAGFAYPPKLGNQLHGKAWLSIITTGGPDWSYQSGAYNNFSMSELLKPFQQTAYLCGMKWLQPFIVHGVLPGDYEEIQATNDDALHQSTLALESFLLNLDLHRTRSIEPVQSLPYLQASQPS